ncbi:MAG: hypothetical protein QMC17_00465 [Paracoccaceae bacterium]|jgi:hypothetical protein
MKWFGFKYWPSTLALWLGVGFVSLSLASACTRFPALDSRRAEFPPQGRVPPFLPMSEINALINQPREADIAG